jgi:hypothetical protein
MHYYILFIVVDMLIIIIITIHSINTCAISVIIITVIDVGIIWSLSELRQQH